MEGTDPKVHEGYPERALSGAIGIERSPASP